MALGQVLADKRCLMIKPYELENTSLQFIDFTTKITQQTPNLLNFNEYHYIGRNVTDGIINNCRRLIMNTTKTTKWGNTIAKYSAKSELVNYYFNNEKYELVEKNIKNSYLAILTNLDTIIEKNTFYKLINIYIKDISFSDAQAEYGGYVIVSFLKKK